jgi:hypothetical protein
MQKEVVLAIRIDLLLPFFLGAGGLEDKIIRLVRFFSLIATDFRAKHLRN